MKRLVLIVLLVFALPGCGQDEMDGAMDMRERFQQCNGCVFDVKVTADYGDVIHSFKMECQTDDVGNLSFCVSEPETIAGITGIIDDEGGKLTFDDKALAFELLADGQVTPVSAPWILIRTLRSGYLNACSRTDDKIMLVIDDSYAEEALQLNIWLNEDYIPLEAEIFWDGRRILTLEVDGFTYL